MFQYDFETQTIYKIPTHVSSGLQLTPNFKQIIQGSSNYDDLQSDSLYMVYNLINSPDSAGLACNFQFRADTVLNVPNFIAPSAIVNFRLGKIEGSPCDTIVSSITEIIEKEVNIHLYPNPARDIIYVEFPYPNGKAYQIEIIDAMGRRVYSSNLSAEGGSLLLSKLHLTPGLYVLQARRDEKVYYKRFLYAAD